MPLINSTCTCQIKTLHGLFTIFTENVSPLEIAQMTTTAVRNQAGASSDHLQGRCYIHCIYITLTFLGPGCICVSILCLVYFPVTVMSI